MKKILGLDLGTNSIGWAVVNANKEKCDDDTAYLQPFGIDSSGSRIIPMDAAILGDFDKGNSISQTAERTGYRGVRRLRERHLLRRERLHRILDLLGFLPQHYAQNLDRYGKISSDTEPKLPWRKNEQEKFEFIFQDSFNEMLSDFRKSQSQLVSDGQKIPYDWTIYYLRKKALSQKISKEELAWLILNFNQKRGYYQLRGEEEEENPNKLVEFYALKVVAVEDSGDKKGKDTWYNVKLENGWIYRRTSSIPLDWVGKTKEFIVTTDLNEDGTLKTDKDGNVKRSFRAPKEEDWTLVKKRTENDIDKYLKGASNRTVGTYIYDTLLRNPKQKVRGKLVRTIERKYYKDELRQILEKQKEFHSELRDKKLFAECVNELYSNNEAHKNNINNCDFTYLFMDDIIFYQRPLKSKKSLIDNCPYESHFDKDGKEYPVKCIAKSHPLYQEFRLWQFVSNLRIYQREKEVAGKLKTDVDVTSELLKNEDDYTALYEWLNDRKEITQDTLIGSYFKVKKPRGKNSVYPYRWNYVEDKTYPCNETRAAMLSRLEKAGISADFLSIEKEEVLWHILYSVEDKQEIVKALKSYADKYKLNDNFVESFKKFPPYKKDYGSYSAKAIKKLLPLMRMGKYWNEKAIDKNTKQRIDKIITGEYDETIPARVREKAINLTEVSHFRNLPLWLACYVVYNRHSEAKDVTKWEKPKDIDAYLKTFKQHSLRNPIVEQVITETLRTVRDILKQVEHIDEIHVELGREMKNPADKRAKMTQQIADNENTNLRIKALLAEFMNPEFGIENVRPYSPSQQDILRIYEDGVLNSISEIPEEVETILKKFNESDEKKRPTHSEFMRYKLWLEQKYRSPYTGEVIPLGRLFTPAYEIEHIIPQSRYFDDSFSNKVICEAEVNKLKDKDLGYEFIKNHHGEKVELNFEKNVEILSVEAYEKFVKENYSRNRGKMKKLLMDEIPVDFIQRQLNDSRYISKVVKGLLSNIVREEGEQEAISKNVITCTGGITDRLKKDWGMNDVWNEIILPRFERLNRLTGKTCFTTTNKEGHVIPDMPLELQKGFNKKRIDHRHHAMDAIVIACASRNIVNYLNNESASKKSKVSRYDLQKLLCNKIKTDENGNYKWILKKPWDTFSQDARVALEHIIVSFKQNTRVINKTLNHYQHYDENGKKTLMKQEKGDSWAIRKQMHKETVFAKVNLRKIREVRLSECLKNPQSIVDKELKEKVKELLAQKLDEKKIKKYFEDNKDSWSDINLSKIKVYYFTEDRGEHLFATRKNLDTSFDRKKIEGSVTDTGIQKILLNHLKVKDNNPDLAFSPDGIDEMNRNIKELNDGKMHQPILKVRVYEQAEKFAIGQKGNKKDKFVEAAKGTNLFFAVYQTKFVDKKTGEEKLSRSYATIPLNVAIEREKQGLKPVPETNETGDNLLFWLSPNDLVYLPTKEELENGLDISSIDKNKIYKMVSCTGNRLYCIPYFIANTIIDKIEYTQLNKLEFTDDKESIKEICIPIKVDRLGNIIEINGEEL